MQSTKPARRIVTIDDKAGKSTAIQDGPAPDVRTDPARPGFLSTRIWLTDRAPPRIGPFVDPTLGPHTLEPPKNGSVCRIVTFPPDATFKGKIGSTEVAAYFNAMGSPGASTYSAKAPNPYMQKTRTLDFCWCSKARSRSCSIPRRCSSRPATRSCSAAPITHGATARIVPA